MKTEQVPEFAVVCSDCSFPVIEVRSPLTGDWVGTVFDTDNAPADEEAAEAVGWVNTGLGYVCPMCAPAYQAEAEERAQISINVGSETLAEGLAEQIQEAYNE